eukprot:4636844-Amphidinium_carterae.1
MQQQELGFDASGRPGSGLFQGWQYTGFHCSTCQGSDLAKRTEDEHFVVCRHYRIVPSSHSFVEELRLKNSALAAAEAQDCRDAFLCAMIFGFCRRRLRS